MFSGPATLRYHKIWLADFFHGFVHLDFSLSETSASFNPQSKEYRESLGLWAVLPFVSCSLFLLGYLVFFCIRCCRTPPPDSQPSRCHRCCCSLSVVFLLVACAAFAVILYGNGEFHRGVVSSVHGMKTSRKTVQSALQIIKTVARISDTVEQRWVPDLMEAVGGIDNSTVHDQIMATILMIGQNANATKLTVAAVENSTSGLATDMIADEMSAMENIRWVSVMVISCIYILVFVIIFAGLTMKSRRKLILSVVLSLVMTPAVWAMSSLHLALAVGGGDLCVDPDSFVLTQLNGTVNGELLSAYMDCTDNSQPFGEEMLNAQTAVSQALLALNSTVAMSAPYNISDKLAGLVRSVQGDLQSIFGNLSSLNTLVGGCRTLHNQYTCVVRGVCNSSLYGVGYLVVSFMVVALCSGVLVLFTALTVSALTQGSGQRQGYQPIDDTDPFVPIPRPSYQRYGAVDSASQDGNDQRFADVVRSINDGDQPLLNEDLFSELPPSPHLQNHLQEYTDLAPTPEMVQRAS